MLRGKEKVNAEPPSIVNVFQYSENDRHDRDTHVDCEAE